MIIYLFYFFILFFFFFWATVASHALLFGEFLFLSFFRYIKFTSLWSSSLCSFLTNFVKSLEYHKFVQLIKMKSICLSQRFKFNLKTEVLPKRRVIINSKGRHHFNISIGNNISGEEALISNISWSRSGFVNLSRHVRIHSHQFTICYPCLMFITFAGVCVVCSVIPVCTREFP